MKECVPNIARAKRFPLKKGKSSVITERKQFSSTISVNTFRQQFPSTLGHAITVHKSQGSTPAYMQGDLNRYTIKKTERGKDNQQPISHGEFCTLLSRAKSRDRVLLLNFEPEDIKVNESALEEMVRLRKSHYFSDNTAY